ncbi:MAG TPA: response regulator transcription factor [Candidatus Acidoferrales bacterium]|nr:response regulator transcription factor [Candidatus Acidoferrales bacterium]
MSHLSSPVSGGINVLIADADRLGAHLIADELRRGRHDICVVAVSNNSAETLRELERVHPDVALINARLEDGPLAGYHVLQSLHPLCPKTAAVMLIPETERDLVVDAFRGGARGVFCRIQSMKLLSKCIRTVHEGQIWATNQTLAFILDFLTQLKPLQMVKAGGGMNRLTSREAEVVHLLAEGLSTREISQKLALTEHTIRNYLCNIYEKLGVSTRVELALYAVAREDLTSPPRG